MVQKHARVLPEIDFMLAVNNQLNNGIFIIYFSKIKSFSYEYFQTHAKENREIVRQIGLKK